MMHLAAASKAESWSGQATPGGHAPQPQARHAGKPVLQPATQALGAPLSSRKADPAPCARPAPGRRLPSSSAQLPHLLSHLGAVQVGGPAEATRCGAAAKHELCRARAEAGAGGAGEAEVSESTRIPEAGARGALHHGADLGRWQELQTLCGRNSSMRRSPAASHPRKPAVVPSCCSGPNHQAGCSPGRLSHSPRAAQA